MPPEPELAPTPIELTTLLNEEHRANPALKDFKDVDALAKAFTDTKAMVGNMIRIPGPDAGTEDIAAFKQKLLESDMGVMPTPDFTDEEATLAYYRKMGTPEEATGYSPIEGMAEERFDVMSRLAHEAGISDKQFTQVASQMLAADQGVLDAINGQREEGVSALKAEWGDAYAQKFARVQRLAEATKAPAALLKALTDSAIDAATLKWIDSIAESLGGEGAQLKDDLASVTQDTRNELEQKRDELTRKLQTERLPAAEHERLVQKLVGYNQRIVAGTG